MGMDIEDIKRMLLIRFPPFGSIIANLKFREDSDIETAETNGIQILYNPEFVNNLSDKEKVFLFAHEVCHVALDHIYRSEGKDIDTWNIATDAVINSSLQQEGLPLIEGGVDIPDAANYDADEIYERLLKNNQNQKNNQNSQRGHHRHSLWSKAIEDKKKRRKNGTEKESEKVIDEAKKKFANQGEQEVFKKIKSERAKKLKDFSKKLVNEAANGAGNEIQREGRKLEDIGIVAPIIDWRRLLIQDLRYEEEWTRKNARMRNGYFKHRLEQIPMPETEILLDVSGSVSEILLKNFLRECKNIISNSKVKVGCFNAEFHGFTEIRRQEEIDSLSFPIGGGTDFNVAVKAFSRGTQNKILFTDGKSEMPVDTVRGIIWVVFGNKKINPKGGKVINITGEQLEKLCQNFIQYEDVNKDR